MPLSKSQLYYMKKAKTRKAKVIIAAIRREFAQGSCSVTSRIIKARMNKELHTIFKIKRNMDLKEKDFDRAIKIIKNYRFLYCGIYYG